MSGLHNRGGVSGVHAADRTPTPKITINNTKINTETHAQTYKDKNRPNKYKTATHMQVHLQKATREIQVRPEKTHCGVTFAPNTRVLFFARCLVCANTTRSELRDKTIFARSNWCRMLALDPLSRRAREGKVSKCLSPKIACAQ